MITFKQLKKLIEAMPEERQDDTATVYDHMMDEYVPVSGIAIAKDDSVLDFGHHIITLHEED